MSGGLPRDTRLERLVARARRSRGCRAGGQAAAAPPAEQRPRRISVTPSTGSRPIRSLSTPRRSSACAASTRSTPTIAREWKGIAVHKVLEDWLKDDDCDPDKLRPRAEALLRGETIHPMLRALWAPRLLEAIDWIGEQERENRDEGRLPLQGRDQRRDRDRRRHRPRPGRPHRPACRRRPRDHRLQDRQAAVAQKAVDEGFALQLGLLGLIARAGGFRRRARRTRRPSNIGR